MWAAGTRSGNSCRRTRNRNAADGEVVFLDTSGSYVLSKGRLAALVGVKDLVVIVEDDAVLVADRSRSEDLRLLVERLRAEGRPEADTHARIYRPWGFYQNIDRGERFQVKRIVVKPGARLSLQKHMHRSEHWVVVRGTARVTIGDQVTRRARERVRPIFRSMRSTGWRTRAKFPLELIEVQSGSYLAEDDIVRVEDDYRRMPKPKE